MSQWALKRFWTSVEVKTQDQGFAVLLDARVLKTPAKNTLIVPTLNLAHRIAEEWEAQEDQINPQSMPFTRTSNAAIDKVSAQFDDVVEHLVAYCETDLLCYRADGPEALVERQSSHWDKLVLWSKDYMNAPLICAQGVMHVQQSAQSIQVYRNALENFSVFELAAMHDLIGLSGSCVASFALVYNVLSAEDMWDACRIDENWQREQWGADTEADALAQEKRRDFFHAYEYLRAAAVS